MKTTDQHRLQEAYKQTFNQQASKLLREFDDDHEYAEPPFATAYLLYGDNPRGGIEIHGVFESESQAIAALNKSHPDGYDEDGYIQIQAVPYGSYRSTPFLKSSRLQGSTIRHAPIGARRQ